MRAFMKIGTLFGTILGGILIILLVISFEQSVGVSVLALLLIFVCSGAGAVIGSRSRFGQAEREADERAAQLYAEGSMCIACGHRFMRP